MIERKILKLHYNLEYYKMYILLYIKNLIQSVHPIVNVAPGTGPNHVKREMHLVYSGKKLQCWDITHIIVGKRVTSSWRRQKKGCIIKHRSDNNRNICKQSNTNDLQRLQS